METSHKFIKLPIPPNVNTREGESMGKVVITLDVPDGMEEVVKSILEREAKLLMKRLSKADFRSTFGILKGKRKSVDEIEADIHDE